MCSQHEARSESARERLDFLKHVYSQMFDDIKAHMSALYASINVLAGAIAAVSLVEKNIISFDLATTLIILISAWVLAHTYSTSYWYNRNLAIIANIERQFLTNDDLHEIHYYFGQHRPNNRMTTHLSIQWWLGLGIGLIFFLTDICSHLGFGVAAAQPVSNAKLIAIPIMTAAIGFVVVARVRRAQCSLRGVPAEFAWQNS